MSERDRAWDLLICIRCHAYPALIRDTIDAVQKYTDPRTTKLICAVDNQPRVAATLERTLPGHVYCSQISWGWGAGLYGLLAESILWANSRWKFGHFLSIDYDTLFIDEDVDQFLLGLITEPEIGLIGEYNARNVHWEKIFATEKKSIKKAFGSIPRTYRPGEGVQGGLMLLTNGLLQQLSSRSMLTPPFSNARNVTRVADDHLITLFCRMCELEIAQVAEGAYIRWHLDCDPIGLQKRGIKVFHPTKIRPGHVDPRAEKGVRNYYRHLRGMAPLV